MGLTQASPSSPLNTSVAKAIAFMANQSLNDGQYTLEWSATDNIGIQEQNQQLVPAAAGQTTCPLPPGVTGPAPTVPPGGARYTTTLFSAQLNVDSTPPTITPTFTPGTFSLAISSPWVRPYRFISGARTIYLASRHARRRA